MIGNGNAHPLIQTKISQALQFVVFWLKFWATMKKLCNDDDHGGGGGGGNDSNNDFILIIVVGNQPMVNE